MRQRTTEGWGSGLLGVIIFSGSLPATRVAVGGFSPLFLTSARAVIAALLGAALLLVLRQKRRRRGAISPSLAIVALGVVVGFPLLTALALQHITAAHSIVFIGLLPLATAIFGVLRGGERPKPAFWLFSGVGSAAASRASRWSQSGGRLARGRPPDGRRDPRLRPRLCGRRDAVAPARRLAGHLLGARAVAARHGGRSRSRRCPPTWTRHRRCRPGPGLAYVSVFSMLVGFVFWYRGLALGGIAGVGQLAAAPALLRPAPGGASARRARPARHGRRHGPRRPLRRGRQALRALTSLRRLRGGATARRVPAGDRWPPGRAR